MGAPKGDVPVTDSTALDGSTRTLRRGALGPLNVLAIAVAAISPTTSVFLVYGAGLASAGTGVIWAFLIGAVIALAMAYSYAEMGSMFPSAGGAYTIVRRGLGPVWGGITLVLFLVLGVVITASILLAAATYLAQLIGGLPVSLVALAMMAVITALSVGKISPASWVAGLMLAVELVVILTFTALAFLHPALGADPLTHPSVPGPHGGLLAVGAAGMIAAIVPALFAYNGYDWPLYFAEESRDARRVLPRAVMLAVVISVVIEVLAVVAATLAIKDLPATAANAAPLSLIAHRIMGPVGADLLLVGVVIAMFDTGLAGNLAYARIYFAASRDRMWPGPVNEFFGHLGARSRVPVYGFMVLFVGNAVLCVFTSLNNLITFTGVIIVVIYLLVAASAIVARVRDKGLARPFTMPLWPVPPLIAIAGVAIALSQQTHSDLVITAIIILLAAAAYLAVRHRLPARLTVGALAATDPEDPVGVVAQRHR
ncbi:MAG: APC family permease [Actinomycetes bacterium]